MCNLTISRDAEGSCGQHGSRQRYTSRVESYRGGDLSGPAAEMSAMRSAEKSEKNREGIGTITLRTVGYLEVSNKRRK